MGRRNRQKRSGSETDATLECRYVEKRRKVDGQKDVKKLSKNTGEKMTSGASPSTGKAVNKVKQQHPKNAEEAKKHPKNECDNVASGASPSTAEKVLDKALKTPKEEDNPSKNETDKVNQKKLDKVEQQRLKKRLKKQRRKELQKAKKERDNVAAGAAPPAEKVLDKAVVGIVEPEEATDPSKNTGEDVASVPTSSTEEKPLDPVEQLRQKKQRRKELQKAKKERRERDIEEARKILKEAEAAAEKKRNEKKSAKKAVEEVSNKQSFRTLDKGVQCQDVVVGKGPPVRMGSKIRVMYTLRAKNRTGKVIDSSKNFSFRLGCGEVIVGWDIGVQGMQLGGRRYLIIPPKAGYGQQNIGAGKGGMLFFDVTVVGV